MDTFSAKMVLAMGQKNSDAAADLYKRLKNSGNKCSKEDREWIEKNIGKEVIIGDDKAFIGSIVKVNEAVGGFYPGDRYPVVVRTSKGYFEYSRNDIKLRN